jgi:Kdo2-lipid IVA lauroyltransferase/acyltransferase
MKILFIRSLLRIFSWIPLGGMQFVALVVGRIIFLFPNIRMVKVARTNIDICLPELTAGKKKEVLLGSVSRSVMVGLEMPYIFFRGYSKVASHMKSTLGMDKVLDSLASESSKGVLMVGSHIGCWEICIVYLSKIMKMNVLYTPQKNKNFDLVLKQARTRYGLNMIPASLKGIKDIHAALKRKEVVVLLTDQVPTGGKGATQVPFFGKNAATMTLPRKLYEKFSPDVFMVSGLSKGVGKGFDLYFDDISKNIGIAKDTCSINDYFAYGCNLSYEPVIRGYPTQYQWIYKRFKYSDWYSYS